MILDFLIAAGAALMAGLLLGEAGAVSEGIRTALIMCATTLIPALFPFMALCGFISRSKSGAVLARPLGFLWRRVFKIPGEAGAVALLGMIGGYPVGARGVASLLERGVLDRKTAERMLCFCVNCGPSFLITAVGVGLMLDKAAGIILFSTQTATSLLIGVLISIGKEAPLRDSTSSRPESVATALVSAISGAASAMLVVCAFAVLFSGLLSVVSSGSAVNRFLAVMGIPNGIGKAVMAGFFEVTSGSAAAAALGGEAGFIISSLCASFGGLSVIFQVAACFSPGSIRLAPFILSRIIHMPIACAMALPLWRYYCKTTAAMLLPPSAVECDSRTWLAAACLIGMCTILLTISAKDELHNFSIWGKIRNGVRVGKELSNGNRGIFD